MRIPIAALIALAAGLLVWHGSWKRSSGPAAGQSLRDADRAVDENRADAENGDAAGQSPRDEDGDVFRVCTFNIQTGKDKNGDRDVLRTAEAIREFDADFIGLNEVKPVFFASPVSQAQRLGDQLQMSWLYAPSERMWWQEWFGNALLSRKQVTHWQRVPLPSSSHQSHRCLVLATFQHQGQDVRAVVTHLDRKHDTDAQLRTTAAFFLSLAEPAVLMGDFNATVQHPEIRKLMKTPGVRLARGLSEGELADNDPRVDWIFLRGLECVESGSKDSGASDHPAFWADLRLVPQQSRSVIAEVPRTTTIR